MRLSMRKILARCLMDTVCDTILPNFSAEVKPKIVFVLKRNEGTPKALRILLIGILKQPHGSTLVWIDCGVTCLKDGQSVLMSQGGQCTMIITRRQPRFVTRV